MKAKWWAVVIASTVGLTAIALAASSYLLTEGKSSYQHRKAKLKSLLSAGDRMWNEQDHFAAIEVYKRFLAEEPLYSYDQQWFDAYPRVYRRVIEHEAKYGDPGEAVDWIVKAQRNDYVGRLTFHAPEAKALLDEVQQQNQLRR